MRGQCSTRRRQWSCPSCCWPWPPPHRTRHSQQWCGPAHSPRAACQQTTPEMFHRITFGPKPPHPHPTFIFCLDQLSAFFSAQCQLLTLVPSGLSSTIQRGSPSPHLAISTTEQNGVSLLHLSWVRSLQLSPHIWNLIEGLLLNTWNSRLGSKHYSSANFEHDWKAQSMIPSI